MTTIDRTEAIRKIAGYQQQLKDRRPDMADDFAEAMATYMVLNGIKKPKEARMAVWMMGETGLDKLRSQVAAL